MPEQASSPVRTHIGSEQRVRTTARPQPHGKSKRMPRTRPLATDSGERARSRWGAGHAAPTKRPA